MRRCYLKKAGGAFLAVLLASQGLHADDVTESINDALEQYKEGEFSNAIESLEYATQVIRQKKANTLEAYLPEALEGWQVAENRQQAGAAALFGGGISSSRSYRRGSSSVTVSIAADSPILQSMMMLFSNPAIATADGGTLEKIKRQKAIVTYSEPQKKGDIKIVVKKRFFVTVEGRDVSREELVAYANAIEYTKLDKLP
jgi:hypothetical protein